MIKKKHTWIVKLTSLLSYQQKYYLILFLFSLGYMAICFFMLKQIRLDLQDARVELIGSEYQRPLQQLMQHVIHYQMLAERFRGNPLGRSDLISLQGAVQEEFRKIENLNKEYNFFNERDVMQNSSRERLMIDLLIKDWEEIKKQSMMGVSFVESRDLFRSFLQRNLNFIENVNDAAGLLLDDDPKAFHLIHSAFVILPQAQFILAQMLPIIQEISLNKSLPEEQKISLYISQDQLRNLVESAKKSLSKAFFDKNSSYHIKSSLSAAMENYSSSVAKFSALLEQEVLTVANLSSGVPSEVIAQGVESLEFGFNYWESIASFLNHIFEERISRVKYKLWGSLAIVGGAALLGFLLGQFFIREVLRGIHNLSDAISRLTSGELGARVTVLYKDELGMASISFNQMAETFERMITQLRNLLDATKRLSDGDFSARVEIGSDTNDEIFQVSTSFNNMAQTFEEIISQLHQLGINLTTSATEIAGASKQQETIIVEQEATTREISVTANEISTTAKEFAVTVSEVSKVGEQTSTLAVAGKESLGHMETIMRQMVDASGSIASKLAVLNEKAGNITGVITTITKVADQTNLLSLNAAIEAEKAGEFGRSFSVIAREIRRLADQTALATLDIEKIVNEIMSAVSSSVMGVDDFTQEIRNGVEHVGRVGEQLSTIIEQVQVLTKRFESVNQGMQTQSTAAEQINEAMAQLSHTARLTTESIHQFRTTIQQLNAAATDLRITVAKIKK